MKRTKFKYSNFFVYLSVPSFYKEGILMDAVEDCGSIQHHYSKIYSRLELQRIKLLPATILEIFCLSAKEAFEKHAKST